jgi:hypothetical protein
MNRNIRFLAFSFATLTFTIGQACQAQRMQELMDYESETATQAKVDSNTFYICADLTSIATGLMGGGSSENLHIGLQLRYLRKKIGFRFSTQYYPQTESFFGNTRSIEVIGSEILTQSIMRNGKMVRVGFGIEFSNAKSFGRSYFGFDFPISYQNVQVGAFNSLQNPVSGEWTNIGTGNPQVGVNSTGVGLSPLLGIEIYSGERIGFNIEAKADFSLMIGEGYFIDDNAVVTKSGTTYNFRTFPLLNFRIHYRI